MLAAAGGKLRCMPDNGNERPKHHVPHPPDVDQGVQAFLWAIVLGFLIWAFLMGIGSSLAFSTLIGALATAGIFFAVRILGEEQLTRTRRVKR